MSEEQKAAAPAGTPKPAAGKGKMLVLIAMILTAVLAGGGGTYFFFGHKAKAEGETAKVPQKLPGLYVKLDPPFVVNFEAKGAMRFLQVTVEIMTRDPATVELITKNDPMIRNDLIMLFGNKRYEEINTRQGKETLRADALKVVADILTAEGGDGSKVEQLYFTSFVMQ